MASCGDTNGEHVQSTCMCAVTHRWTYPQYAARILRSSHRNAGAPSGDTMASCGDTMASCGEFGVTLRTCSPDACSTPVISHSRLYLWSVNVPSTDRSVCIGRLSGVAYGQREARLAVWLHDAQGNYIRTISDALERGPELVSERRSSRTKVWRALSQALLSDR